jgi:hypothetical protein
VPAHFDMVLVIEDQGQYTGEGVLGECRHLMIVYGLSLH